MVGQVVILPVMTEQSVHNLGDVVEPPHVLDGVEEVQLVQRVGQGVEARHLLGALDRDGTVGLDHGLATDTALRH